jgi:hypothetical protein
MNDYNPRVGLGRGAVSDMGQARPPKSRLACSVRLASTGSAKVYG